MRTFDDIPGVLPTVVLLPFAGAHRNSYASIQRRLKGLGVSSSVLEAPGHGSRFGEACCTSFDDLLDDMWRQLREHDCGSGEEGVGFVLAGHSMGALLAWQLAVRSSGVGANIRGLVVSGRGGPGTPRRRPDLHALPSNQFVQELQSLGGCPDEILRNRDVMELIVPILRADFRCVESARDFSTERLEIPVGVLVGSADTITYADAMAWSRVTTHTPEIRVQSGGHFHLLDDVDDTVDFLITFLEGIRMSTHELQSTTFGGGVR